MQDNGLGYLGRIGRFRSLQVYLMIRGVALTAAPRISR